MKKQSILPEETKYFQKKILEFYKKQGRKLPWRKTTNPYHILVSELMLQQTQVDRVIPKYNTFIKQYPNKKTLAKTNKKDLLRAWQGLGYNRRAIYLQEASKKLSNKPTYEELLEIKGIGPYTAAAITIFAYNEERTTTDTNIKRIFERQFNKEIQEQTLPKGKSRDWHNALMDFGSMICKKKNPLCNECPIKKNCHAYNNNLLTEEKKKKTKTFKGSNRWHRGKIIQALIKEPQTKKELYKKIPKPKNKKQFEQAIQELKQEKFIQEKKGTYNIN